MTSPSATGGSRPPRRSVDGVGFLDPFRPGDWVSLHWGWVCDRLSRRQLQLIRQSTLRQFEITNRRVVHSGAQAGIERGG